VVDLLQERLSCCFSALGGKEVVQDGEWKGSGREAKSRDGL
jgi:hypothetical protein